MPSRRYRARKGLITLALSGFAGTGVLLLAAPVREADGLSFRAEGLALLGVAAVL